MLAIKFKCGRIILLFKNRPFHKALLIKKKLILIKIIVVRVFFYLSVVLPLRCHSSPAPASQDVVYDCGLSVLFVTQ